MIPAKPSFRRTTNTGNKTMNAKEWQAILNKREYRNEMSRDEEKQAKLDRVLICFSASDDLLEFRGIIDDEVGAWEGTTVKLTPELELFDPSENKESQKFNNSQINKMLKITALWAPKNEENKTWASFHVTSSDFEFYWFDIMEEGEIYCRGFVVDESELKKAIQYK